tara:strand:- start:322 stop:684 length:363 start_codon:yes stop_codon:yes gene_type:complete
MTCGLHGKLDTAVTAVKEALTAALEADVSENELDNLVCAYKGLKSVQSATKDHAPQITFTPDPTLGGAVEFNENITINTDDLVGAADTVHIGSGIVGGIGSDVITFGNDITFGDDIDKDT